MADKKPEQKPSVTAYIVPVIGLLFLGALMGYQYQQQGLDDPEARLNIAHEALMNANDAKAFQLFSSLAEAGNGRAQYWLADMYENGYGIKKDITKALEFYQKSAAQAVLPAEARLGEIYLMGEESVQDFSKAREWLQKSARHGNGRAERLLGQMEAHGFGGPKDVVSAYAWYQLAILDGDGMAMRMRDSLLETMSPTQTRDGQALAEKLNKEVAATRDKSATVDAHDKTGVEKSDKTKQ